MSQTSKTVLVVVITAAIVGGLIYWWQTNAITGVRSTATPDEKGQQNIGVQPYKNDRLKLTFSYPKDMGPITEDELPPDGHVTLRLSGDIFLAADSGERDGDRGSYWGDYASFLNNQSTITNFCNEPFTFPDRIKNCNVLQNQNGISYAKTQEEICTEGGCSGIATSYYIYNPNSEFRGIVISSDRLRDNSIPQLDEKLDEIVKSINFVK